MAWTRPSAISSAITLNTRPSASTSFAPGWPLTSTTRTPTRPSRAPALIPAASDRPPRSAAPPGGGARERRHLAAAVAVQHHVVGQQRLEPLEVALLRRG